jgi:hypothetical protein
LDKPDASPLDHVKRLVLRQVSSPQGVWQGNANAVAKVKAMGSVAELIAACRSSWEWSRE